MEEEDSSLQLDDSFFDLPPAEIRSCLESTQATALLEEADVQGEAAEAFRCHHHSFQNSFNSHPLLNHFNIHPQNHTQDQVLELNDFLEDDHEEDETDRSTKKRKPDLSNHQPTVDNNVDVQDSSRFDEHHQLIRSKDQENRTHDLEPDDSFDLSPDPGLKDFEENYLLAAQEPTHHINESHTLGLDFEVDDDFIASETQTNTVAPILKSRQNQPMFDDAPPSFDDMLNEAENFEENHFSPDAFPSKPAALTHQRSSDSFDELMNEAENYQQKEVLRSDSQFFESSMNGHPTSAQRPLPVVTSSSSAPISLINSTTSVTQSRWIPDTSMLATRLDGAQFQVPRRKRIGSQHPNGPKSTEELQKRCLDILEEPIHRMLAKARQDISRKQVPSSNVMTLPQKKPNRQSLSLWTDKYRPVKFIDLIGDERVFRSAMGWLKTWDRCVFKKTELSHKRKRMLKSFQGQSNSNYPSNSEVEVEMDPYGRPREKVLLLSGKPGLGKTTMAQVLAHQAGYQVIEINASDDRSAKTVTDHIKAALESRTLDGGAKTGGGLSLKDNRPTCVIIDEIDGAAGGGGGGQEAGFVKALVQLVTDGSINVMPKTSTKGKKSDKRPLLRPIICICNDLYAPVLRPLRPISRIIRFSSPTPTAIVKRLQTICQSEKIIADVNNLNYLVRLSRGDLRSCLNTLQFISDQEKNKVLNDQIIKSAVDSGVKDSAASIQTVLSRLFKIPVKPSGKSNQSGSNEFYLDNLVRDISTCGQNERIVQGCFESYLNMKQPTDLWGSYSQLFDWLEFYDRLETRIWTDQAYQLLGYVPYSIAIWREIFGSLNNNKMILEYPKIEYENHSKKIINEEIILTFKQIIPATILSCFKSQEIICELLPLLIRSISVDLRPVNFKLIQKQEKEILMRVVQIMFHLGLKFVLDKSEDGQLSYTLEPPIDFSVNFDGIKPIDIPPARYSVRQMILNEMNSFSIRGRNDTDFGNSNDNIEMNSAISIRKAYQRNPIQTSNTHGENLKVKLDFFGRKQINEKDDVLGRKSSLTKNNSKEKIKVLYRYHEGFSNAVKKSITFNELIFK